MTSDKNDQAGWREATRLVRGGLTRTPFSETSEALFMSSGYVYATAEEAERTFKGDIKRYIYSRYANPTLATFEARLALAEDAKFCRGTASGMAAVFAALLAPLKAGDRVVAARALFGSCHYIVADLLPRYGISTEFVDGTDLDQWKAALSRPANAVFLETPSNPTLEVVDLAAISALTHAAGARLIVDNVFATPVLQKPLRLGADIVVYSTTKHIDGQGRSLGGAILTDDEALMDDQIAPFLRHTGPALSPFNAWLLIKGLETLDLRVRRQTENAHQAADFLAGQGGIVRVLYPGRADHPQYDLCRRQMAGGGTMVAFDVEGGREGSFRFMNALRLIDISNNLGDTKSLITHPATSTHESIGAETRARMGIGDGLLRLSVGLEDPADLCEDLAGACQAARGG
ncbi:MAG: O-succinylhomoserine sulfhydrylase [Rhodospirillales bacterium]|jgi:O-succinylhomoserine sulfhydrylase|nr:O-succinylhomoserine sulfhydrylase [Rhodospirillales bacterium]